MNRKEFEKFEHYLKTDVGMIDESLYDMSLIQHSLSNSSTHVVRIDDRDGICGLFLRGTDPTILRASVMEILSGVKDEGKREALVAASVDSKPFLFNWVGEQRAFLNNVRVPSSRPGINVESRSLVVLEELASDFFENRYDGTLIPSPRGRAVQVFSLEKALTGMDFGWVSNFLENFSIGAPGHGQYVAPGVYPDKPIYVGQVLDKEGYKDGFYPLVDEGDEIVTAEDGKIEYPSSARIVYCAWGGGSPMFDLLKAFGSHYSFSNNTNKVTEDSTRAPSKQLPDVCRKILGRLSEKGFAVTGVVRLVNGKSEDVQETVGEHKKRRDPFVSYTGSFLAKIFVDPGKGCISFSFAEGSLVFDLHQPFDGVHDILLLQGGGNTGFKAKKMRSIVSGGGWGSVNFNAVNIDAELLTLLSCSDRLFNDDCSVKVQSEDAGMENHADPLERHSRALTVDDYLFAMKDADEGNTNLGRPVLLPTWFLNRLAVGGASAAYYMPLFGCMEFADRLFLGETRVVDHKMLAAADYFGEPVPLEVGQEHDWFTGDLKDGFETESDRFDENDTSVGDEESVPMSPVVFSHLVIEPSKTCWAVGSSGVEGLGTGQGLVKRQPAHVVKALNGLVSEIGDGRLTCVEYAKPITIPFNVTDRTILARNYRKARKKACLSDNFDSLEYVKGVTWGQAKHMCNMKGSLGALYNVNTGEPDLVGAPIVVPAKAQYIPGTSPSEVNITYSDDNVVKATVENQDPLWEALAHGVTLSGISLNALSSSWELPNTVDNSDIKELNAALAKVNSASDRVRAALGGAGNSFDPDLVSVLGYPDVKHMTTDDAYKAMIATVVVFDKAGMTLRAALFDVVRTAYKGYIAASQTRQKKLRERYKKK